MQRSHSKNNLGLFGQPKDKEFFNELILIMDVSESERIIKHQLNVGCGMFIEDEKEWFSANYRKSTGSHDGFDQVDFYLDTIKEIIQLHTQSKYIIRDVKIIFNYETKSSFI